MNRGREERWWTTLRACAVALAIAWVSGAAHAVAQTPPHGTDGQPVLFKADEVNHDQDLGLVTARGNVEISQGDRVVRADVVTFNRTTNVVTASGNVSLVEPSGDVIFADFLELSQNMREGTIQNLRMLMADQSRLAAVSGRRADGNITAARQAVYSPCELCKDDPTRAPVWQIKAARIQHDQQAKQITYRDARMEMFGVPIAYTPYLSHPDGTVKRASGFLAPEIASSSRLGPSVAVPYFWAIGSDRDATFEPIVLAKENPVAAGEYRQYTTKGKFDINASITSADRRNDNNDRVSGQDTRGHIKGKGKFDINDDWRWGFDVERATDDTYLQRYRLMRRYGFLNSNTLTSDAYVEGFRGRNYASASAFAFQGLRSSDDPGLTPLVLPMFDANYIGEPGEYGGRYFLDANALSIYRSEGTRMQRTVVRTGWTLPYTASTGEIYSLSFITYGEAYNVSRIGSAADPFRPTEDGAMGRIVPQIGFSWRYPFVRYDGSLTTVIEPIVSLVASPNLSNQGEFPNEDSRTIDFDDTNLFRPNRFAGHDRIEGGQRVNYGFNVDMWRNWGGRLAMFLGQSYRLREDSAFPAGSGLEDRQSNYVGRILASPHPWVTTSYYAQLDKRDYAATRNRASLVMGPSALKLGISYIFIDRQTQFGLTRDIEQLGMTGNARLTEHWRFQMRQLKSLAADDEGTLQWGSSLIYEDDCLIAGFDLTRRYIGNRDNPPDTALVFRMVFRNLGQIQTGLF
jgi:LPS-assembly protein